MVVGKECQKKKKKNRISSQQCEGDFSQRARFWWRHYCSPLAVFSQLLVILEEFDQIPRQGSIVADTEDYLRGRSDRIRQTDIFLRCVRPPWCSGRDSG